MTKTLQNFVLAIVCAACAPAYAQEPAADAIRSGHDFALKVCAACHVVASDQKGAPILKHPAPSFAEIVKRKDFSEQSLRKLLSAPHGGLGRHGKMPNPMLVDYQIDEIAAYMLSLKEGKKAGE